MHELVFDLYLNNIKVGVIVIIITTLSIVPLLNYCRERTQQNPENFRACVDIGKLSRLFNANVTVSGYYQNQTLPAQYFEFNQSRPQLLPKSATISV